MAVNSFKDLRVWHMAMDMVEQIYLLTQQFPSHETYGLSGQMRRAAVSVASNIAEGHAREHTKEFLNHISIAHGSLAELQTQLEIAIRLHYAEHDKVNLLSDRMISLSRQLYALRNSLQKRC